MSKLRSYDIIGAPFGFGLGQVNAPKAPTVLRAAGLVSRLQALALDIHDLGDVDYQAVSPLPGDPKQKFLAQVTEFSELLYARTLASYQCGKVPIVLGGDHSIAIGSVSAASSFIRSQTSSRGKVGLLWVDAHADINTPDTTPSGRLHGMPVAVLLGLGNEGLCRLGGFAPKISAENLAFVGLRDLDLGEKELIRSRKISAFTMKEIDMRGIGAVMKEALKVVTRDTEGFILSFDLDVCDPRIAPAVSTPVRGGLTFRESHLLMELVAESKKLIGIQLAELVPMFDHEGDSIELAISFLESALGKTIL